MTLSEQIRVMQEAQDGWAIQMRLKSSEDWIDTNEPVWNFKEFDYRKKPLVQYRPYSPEEAANIGRFIFSKITSTKVSLLTITLDGKCVITSVDSNYIRGIISLTALFRDYAFDLSTRPPCGMPMSKEEFMTSTAENILLLNPKLLLTGTFMLKQRGISLDREPSDLDFISPGNIGMNWPSSFEVSEYDPNRNKNYACLQFKVNGFKVDILITNTPEEPEIINGLRCASVEGLIKAKQSYLNAEKHKKDLDILLSKTYDPTSQKVPTPKTS